jgi:hypothetical protein
MGLRTISFRVKPSPALSALFTLDTSPTMGATFRAALDDELSRVREPLSLLAECVWWLADRKHFRRTRDGAKDSGAWKPGKPVRTTSLFDGELAVDVAELSAEVESGDEAARVTSVAVRSVADALRDGALVIADDARAGRIRTTVAGLAKEIRAHLERAERAAHRAAERSAKEEERERQARERERIERARERDEKRAREEEARRAREARSTKAHAGKRKAKPSSFGGLPDDAEPEDRTKEREQLSPRGLPLDAEFFLDEARLPWPCEARALDSARKVLLARFHPDRAGEGATAQFQRAMRGYQALIKAIEKGSPSARPPEHAASVAAAHAIKSAPAATAPVSGAPEAKARKRSPRVEHAESAPTVAPKVATRVERPAVSSSAPAGEWPPRAPRAGAK